MRIKTYPIVGLLVCMFFLSVSSVLSAQETPSVSIENKVVLFDNTEAFDVIVTNYNDIIGATFSVEWDPLQLRYVGIENIAFDLTMEENFGLTEANNGRVNYLYFDSSLSGNSLPDNAILFTLNLEAIVDENVLTNISFGGGLEVVDTSETDINANFSGAEVEIMQIVNATDLFDKNTFTALISPNPFSKDAIVQLAIPSTGQLHWTLSEINGQVIAEGEEQVLVGVQSMTLKNTLFKHTGTFIIKLELDGETLTRQLIRIEP